jgi:hypothetical protein
MKSLLSWRIVSKSSVIGVKVMVFVNFDKTKFMIFHNERCKIKEDVRLFDINNIIIERVFSIKYLSLYLDPSLTFKDHFDYVLSKICQRIKFLHGVKRYLNQQAMCSMVNAYLHSVTDYCIDIWTVQNDNKLDLIQCKIDNFLKCYYFPKLAKQKCYRKLNYASLRKSIDIRKIRTDCNFLSLKERSEYVTLKTAFKFYQEGKLCINKRSLELCNIVCLN